LNLRPRGPAVPLLVLLASLLAAPAALAREDRFVLRSSDGKPVARARVAVVGKTGSVVTGVDGEFRLDPVPAPPFELGVADERGTWLGLVRVETLDAASPHALVLAPPKRTEVVVRGGLAPATIGPPAAAPTVVTRTEIDEKRPDRLADALVEIPGTGRLEEGQSVVPSIRGLARSRVLLMVDDGRVTAERRAGTSATYLDPFTFENVEVVRGPGTVAYGSDTLGGVVHVRTPMPTPEETTGRFELSAGARGSEGAAGGAEANVPVGDGALLVQLHQRYFADYESPEGTVDNSGARDRGFLLRGLYPLGGATLTVGFQLDEGRDIGKPSADSNVTRAYYPREDSRRLSLGLDLPGALGFTSVELRAFYGTYDLQTNRYRYETAAAPARLSHADVDADDASFRAVGTRPLGNGSLKAGLDVSSRFSLHAVNEYTDYDRAGAPAGTTSELSVDSASKVDLGAFVEAEQVLVKDLLNAAAGLRGDRVRNENTGGYFGDRSTSDGAISGFAALTVTPARGLSTTLQYARGWRDPLLSDRYYRGVSGRGFVTGNPDLVAETSDQYDLAVRWASGRFHAAAYGYLYRISDLIERYQVGSNFYFRNRGEEEIRGAELEAGADVLPGLQVRLALGTTRGEILDDGSFPADIPPQSLVLTADWAVTQALWLRARWAAYAGDDRPGPTEKATPGYGVVDLGAGYRLPVGLEARLLVRNLFDRAYPGTPDVLNVLAPGRGATLVLAGRF